MPQMLAETKSAKGAATRDQILDAASRLIHLQGYHGTSLYDVHEGFRQRLAQIFAEWRRTLIEALARGQARGELRADCNPERAAHFLVAALEGAILMTKVTKDIGVMEKCVDELKQHLTLYAKS